ncbi:MAG: proton-conducting transporter membrane subunit, partial [Mycobacterium sp.]
GAQLGVVIVGAVTLLFGAVIGCAKDDIKKALAASTMSQIGYMVLAAGLGPAGYPVAIMHLLTHGFFKAGLFLGAGSVMHAMDDEVNMRHYGGLRTLLPITFATFGLGYLAIIGVPPLAGFFSKDGIIEAALGAGGAKGIVLGGATILGAGITAFYMTRVMLMTFFGEARWKDPGGGEAGGEGTVTHPHESPKVMTWPMIVLAVGSVVSGGALAIGGTLEHWLEPVVGAHEAHHVVPAWVVTVVVLSVVAIGILIAYRMYAHKTVPDTAPQEVSALTVAARKDLYGDAINEALLMKSGQVLTKDLVWVDNKGIDGATNGLATLVGRTSDALRLVQTGFARSYALSMLTGVAVLVGAILAVRLW